MATTENGTAAAVESAEIPVPVSEPTSPGNAQANGPGGNEPVGMMEVVRLMHQQLEARERRDDADRRLREEER